MEVQANGPDFQNKTKYKKQKTKKKKKLNIWRNWVREPSLWQTFVMMIILRDGSGVLGAGEGGGGGGVGTTDDMRSEAMGIS